LAVSAPYEDGIATDTGLVQIFPLDDLAAEVSYDQESTDISGTAAANEHFGEGLGFVAGVVERSILVGVPDDVQHTGGMVNVIPLTGGSPGFWLPDEDGTGNDRFGSAVGGEVQQ
jgi:hypothetical protein